MDEKIDNIIKEIKNNNGCNVNLSGDIVQVNSGYMVSLASYEKTINIDNFNNNDLKNDIMDAIIEKIAQVKNLQLLNHKSKFYIGLWYNKSDLKLYIDISINILSKNKAIKQGINQRQFSIYDVKNQCDIELKKDVYIIYKYNKINNDFIYLKEFINCNDAMKFLNITKRGFYNSLVNTIDNFNISKLFLNKYAIVKDKAFYRDLI